MTFSSVGLRGVSRRPGAVIGGVVIPQLACLARNGRLEAAGVGRTDGKGSDIDTRSCTLQAGLIARAKCEDVMHESHKMASFLDADPIIRQVLPTC